MTEDERKARIEKALAHGGGTHTLADVADLVKSGKAQWWDNGDGMIITEIHEFPRLKAVHYWLVAGALRDCLALQHDIDPWALKQGCTIATAVGRRGWGRAAPGWKPGLSNFMKPLCHE